MKRSELRDVVDILSSAEIEELRVETKTHDFENADELMASTLPASEIYLGGYIPRLNSSFGFTLFRNTATLYAGTSDNQVLGAATKLMNYLNGRRPFWARLQGNFAVSLVTTVVAASLVHAAMVVQGAGTMSRVIGVAGVSVVVSLVFNVFPFEAKTIVFAKEDHERKPIDWRSAGWDVFKIILGAGIAIIAGKVLGYKR